MLCTSGSSVEIERQLTEIKAKNLSTTDGLLNTSTAFKNDVVTTRSQSTTLASEKKANPATLKYVLPKVC